MNLKYDTGFINFNIHTIIYKFVTVQAAPEATLPPHPTPLPSPAPSSHPLLLIVKFALEGGRWRRGIAMAVLATGGASVSDQGILPILL